MSDLTLSDSGKISDSLRDSGKISEKILGVTRKLGKTTFTDYHEREQLAYSYNPTKYNVDGSFAKMYIEEVDKFHSNVLTRVLPFGAALVSEDSDEVIDVVNKLVY